MKEDSKTESFDFGKKKKKKTKVIENQKKNEESNQEEIISSETLKEESTKEQVTIPEKSVAGYPYEWLVERVFSQINSTGEQGSVKYTMKPPVVYREGTKKTIWVNFPDICKIMNRSPEHVLSFLLAELGTTGSIDGSGRFVIKGRFQPKHIENILRKYIAEYVKCHTCKTPETSLKRENRLLFMVCDKCGSSRTVTPIKTGFQATTRAVRKAART